MRTIAHISDLHFDRVDAAVTAALVDDLTGVSPNLLVVSGDLTQRARNRQYAKVVEYLGKLPHPQLIIPGNHDMPLFDLLRRFLNPLGRYRQYFGHDLAPFYHDDELAVAGINTTRPWHWSWRGFWKDGCLSPKQAQETQQRLSGLPATVCKVVVTHHPFIPPPDKPHVGIVTGAQHALTALASVGVELVLAGHLHKAYNGDVRAYHPSCPGRIISAQAASATSTRRRGQPNTYNLIRIDDKEIAIEVRGFDGNRFTGGAITKYDRLQG